MHIPGRFLMPPSHFSVHVVGNERSSRRSGSFGSSPFEVASRVLSSQVRNTLSRHLDPFMFPVPEGNLAWPNFVHNQLLEDNRDSLFTWWRNSHTWADRCYSLLFFYLHLTAAEMVTWQNCKSYLSLCDKTIGLYETSSSNRHH